ncbi:methylase [Cryptosporidium ryanae]|uniref:methylase n=1 Tax=Cryptosporidium ryanae TaxID=515981 RepID=UPI00351AA765|nr:methylase [Cryptosporidium ryanae]
MRKRKRDLVSGLRITEFDSEYDNDVSIYLNSLYTGNKLSIIEGTVLSWLELFNDTSLKTEINESDLNNFKYSNTYRAIIINKRKTNLPIRYSNSPRSEIINICSGSLYSVSRRFPCTPLNKKHEKFDKVKITIEDNIKESTKLEDALFNTNNNFGKSIDKFNILSVKKRKKEIKCNLEYISKNISIFPGNTGREYVVFQRYDEGIILDEDAIMDATPEILAQHIARRLRCCTVLDACSGVGGNTIAFSQHCKFVVSVEKSNSRSMINKHNSQIYGLYGSTPNLKNVNTANYHFDPSLIREMGSPELHFNKKHVISNDYNLHMYFDPNSNIVFINGNIMEFCSWYSIKIQENESIQINNNCFTKLNEVFRGFKTFEWAFASPPWGGYSYNYYREFSLDSCKSLNYKDLLIRISSIADNVALFLPRNSNITEFIAFMSILGFNAIEIEEVNDTRYNYTLGLLLYCNKIQDNFRPWYLFGQELINLNDQIIDKLAIFIKYSFNSDSPKGVKITDSKYNNKLALFCKDLLVKCLFPDKIENKPMKIGLGKITVLTYLINYVLYRGDDMKSILLDYCSGIFTLKEANYK